MKAFKSHKEGFTFFEVIAALFIVGMLLSSVLVLQQQSFSSIISTSKKLMLSFAADRALQERLIDSAMGLTEKKERKESSEGVESRVKEERLSGQSALKGFSSLKMVSASASSRERGNEYAIELIAYRYKPKAKKS